MVSKRKRYSREFKIETVRLVTGNDHSVTEVAKDLPPRQVTRKVGLLRTVTAP